MNDAIMSVNCGPVIITYLSNVSVEEINHENQDFVIETDFCEIGHEFSCFFIASL